MGSLSSQHLTYPHTPFDGFTFFQVLVIGGGLLMGSSVGGALLGWLLGSLWAGLLIGFLGSLFCIRFVVFRVLNRLQKGKPRGYLALKTRVVCYRLIGKPLPFVTRQGTWSMRRSV